ncbi:MAG: hypothetical protein IJ468_00395 [Lachnospiraceae bacterium]|nr:hypothetical protein [Lachnospiraceae bacterium]
MRSLKRWKVTVLIFFFLQMVSLSVRAEEVIILEADTYVVELGMEPVEADLNISYSGFIEETDYNWAHQASGKMSYIAVGEGKTYIRLQEYVYFFDIDKQILIPLCNRPDCLHDKETDDTKKMECNAYVDYSMYNCSLQYYQGKLYANSYSRTVDVNQENRTATVTFNGEMLYELALDGSSRDVFPVQLENCGMFMMHRGMIYYTAYETNRRTGEPCQELWAVSVDGKKKKMILRIDGEAESFFYIPYGEYLYTMVANFSENERYGFYMVYDPLSGELYAKQIPKEQSGMIYPFDEKMCSMTESDTLYQFNLNGTDWEEIVTLKVSEPEKFGLESNPKGCLWISMDESYLYRMQWSGMWNPNMQIYDLDSGEMIQYIQFGENEYCMLQRIGITDEYLFCGGFIQEKHKIYWIEKEHMLDPDVVLYRMEQFPDET